MLPLWTEGPTFPFTERSQEWVLSPDLIPRSWYFWVCLGIAPHHPLMGGVLLSTPSPSRFSPSLGILIALGGPEDIPWSR